MHRHTGIGRLALNDDIQQSAYVCTKLVHADGCKTWEPAIHCPPYQRKLERIANRQPRVMRSNCLSASPINRPASNTRVDFQQRLSPEVYDRKAQAKLLRCIESSCFVCQDHACTTHARNPPRRAASLLERVASPHWRAAQLLVFLAHPAAAAVVAASRVALLSALLIAFSVAPIT